MRRLRRISLRGFRNYAQLDLDLGDGITALVGPNGQGKSNLLEAVYLVATGRSHRTAAEGETIMHGAPVARVRAHVARPGRDEEIEVIIAKEQERVSAQIRVNGTMTPRGGVLGRLPVVIATAWDLDLVRGAGSGRRRLLDGTIAQLSPAYFFSLHRYHQVLVQRNAELRAAARTRWGSGTRGSTRPAGSGSLEAWDPQLIALGVRITAHRAAHVERLRGPVSAWFERFGGRGRLEVIYRASWLGDTDEARTEAAGGQVAKVRTDEYRRGVTLTGPHRDEVEFVLDGRALRAAGSQGQWRTAMLAVRLAQRQVMTDELGVEPVLLLDDVLAELDADRQQRVFEQEADAQVLVSTTALPPSRIAVRILRVHEGTITEDTWSRH